MVPLASTTAVPTSVGSRKPAPRRPSSRSDRLRHSRFSSLRSITPREITSVGLPEITARSLSDFMQAMVSTPCTTITAITGSTP